MTKNEILTAAARLANSLMEKHGLIDRVWKFKFDNSKRRFGVCKPLGRIIGLSAPLTLLNWEEHLDEVENTILHEIAHALTHIRHGMHVSAHGWEWKRICVEIGCKPERCYDGSSVNMPKGNFTYRCPNCGKEVQMIKRKKRDFACGDCCKKYNYGRYSTDYKFVLVGQ